MPIAITPVVPTQGGAPVAPEQLLQPGAVIEARILQQLGASLARIAVANTVMEVMTETPLVPGTVMRVTVSQGAGGELRLVATPPDDVGETTPQAPPRADPVAAAVVRAVRQAAPRQSGLSPLFADLAAALEQGQLPPQVRAAAAPLLALRPQLAEGVDAPGLQKALHQSGLLHETFAAAGRPPMPDLKAALIVLRQVLAQWQGGAAQAALTTEPTPTSPPPSATMSAPASIATPMLASVATSVQPGVATPPQAAVTALPGVASTPIAPPLAPDEFVAAIKVARAAGEVDPRAASVGASASPAGKPPATSIGAMLVALQGVDQVVDETLDISIQPRVASVITRDVAGKASDPAPSSNPNAPPPPFRGAAPSAQPVAQPLLSADDPAPVVAHRLLDEVDGALARQTLLQIASLPEQAPANMPRAEQPRWAFEIPFATPQGTAVAQFEISRDGAQAREAEPAKRIWRARFSLNVEPAGPVHAMIALAGERASVRLWADRPETIARLRDGAPLLSHALREAELDPGEIAIGGPPPAAAAATGQFWNRAS